ncbi:ROK family protein [Embleya sp. NPDC056575]|uniref:ROK family protein n=1 Tax=unclassified Embleya TaxID=2699296 RepID=UPI003678ECF4
MGDAIRSAGIRENAVLTVGAASTGIVDRSGRMTRSTRLPGMQGRNLPGGLALRPDMRVVTGKDARVATFAERWLGAGRGIDNFVNIVAGRHITAGIVLDGRLLQGVHGAAGEIGVLPESRRQSALDAVAAWPQGPEATIAAATAGDADAQARVEEFAEHLATGIAAVVLTVDPECVILSGGLSRAGQTLLDPLREHLHAKTLFPVPVHASTLDHNAVALGAVRWAPPAESVCDGDDGRAGFRRGWR